MSINDIILSMTNDELAAQMFVFGVAGTTPESLQKGGESLLSSGVNTIVRDERYKPGEKGVKEDCNISNPQQLKKLLDYWKILPKVRPFISVDAEGGQVMRLKNKKGFNVPSFSAQEMAKRSDYEVELLGYHIGLTCASLGINVNWAPVADVHNPQSSVIGKLNRAFSSDTSIIIRKTSAFLRGLERAGVMGCLKHFPGHGNATGDTHRGFVDITQSWDEVELRPFLEQCQSAPAIMTGHLFHRNIDSDFPASLSKIWMDKLRQAGFEGLIVTDCLQMGAIKDLFSEKEMIWNAVMGGANLLIYTNHINTIKQDPDDCSKPFSLLRITEEFMNEYPEFKEKVLDSVRRILKQKKHMGLITD